MDERVCAENDKHKNQEDRRQRVGRAFLVCLNFWYN